MCGDLLAYIEGIIKHEGAQLIKGNALDDHVHLLLRTKPVHAASDLVRKIKANSSR